MAKKSNPVVKALTPSQRNAIMGTQPSVPTPSQRNAIMGTQPSVPPGRAVEFGLPTPSQRNAGTGTQPSVPPGRAIEFGLPTPSQTSAGMGAQPSVPPGRAIDFGLPTPSVPQTTQTSSNLVTKASVKIATPQYVNFDENVLNPITESDITSLFFEQVAGHELLILSNINFVNTKNVDYQPIANISNFKNTYDPKKIIALQDTSDVYFFNFAINLLARIPDVPTDSSTNGTNVYITASGDLVIETKDNAPDERIQVEIISGGTINTDILGVN